MIFPEGFCQTTENLCFTLIEKLDKDHSIEKSKRTSIVNRKILLLSVKFERTPMKIFSQIVFQM